MYGFYLNMPYIICILLQSNSFHIIYNEIHCNKSEWNKPPYYIEYIIADMTSLCIWMYLLVIKGLGNL